MKQAEAENENQLLFYCVYTVSRRDDLLDLCLPKSIAV